jgi:hypothetical protein
MWPSLFVVDELDVQLYIMAFDISEEQVALTESELGRRLPPVYRAAMMANNGGTAITDEDQWDNASNAELQRQHGKPRILENQCQAEKEEANGDFERVDFSWYPAPVPADNMPFNEIGRAHV